MATEGNFLADFASDKVSDLMYPTGRPTDESVDLVYIDWYHDFGFRRRVRFGEWQHGDGEISLPMYRVEDE